MIGALVLLALILTGIHLRRRTLQRKRTAPSAEFMHHPALLAQRRNSTPALLMRSPSPYADGDTDEEKPPPFTPGAYADPVFEKVQAAAAAHQEMFDPYRGYGGSEGHGEGEAAGAPPDGVGWAV